MVKLNQVLVNIDSPTKNGRTYTRECIEKALEMVKDGLPVFGTIDDAVEMRFRTAIGAATDLRIEGTALMGTIQCEVLPFPPETEFRISGHGMVEEGVVKDFELTGVIATLDPA